MHASKTFLSVFSVQYIAERFYPDKKCVRLDYLQEQAMKTLTEWVSQFTHDSTNMIW